MIVATDAATVFGWLKAIIHHTHNVRTKAITELLIRRRLDILKEVTEQEQLQINLRLVHSGDNKADALSHVPVSWT